MGENKPEAILSNCQDISEPLLLGFLGLLSSQELLETTEKKKKARSAQIGLYSRGWTDCSGASLTSMHKTKKAKDGNGIKEKRGGEGKEKEGTEESEN